LLVVAVYGTSMIVAFKQLGLGDIVTFTLATNPASRRIMEKVGCKFERDIVHSGLPHVLYRLTREVYLAA